MINTVGQRLKLEQGIFPVVMPVGAPHLISAAEFILQCDSKGRFVCYLVAYKVLGTSRTISGGSAT